MQQVAASLVWVYHLLQVCSRRVLPLFQLAMLILRELQCRSFFIPLHEILESIFRLVLLCLCCYGKINQRNIYQCQSLEGHWLLKNCAGPPKWEILTNIHCFPSNRFLLLVLLYFKVSTNKLVVFPIHFFRGYSAVRVLSICFITIIFFTCYMRDIGCYIQKLPISRGCLGSYKSKISVVTCIYKFKT